MSCKINDCDRSTERSKGGRAGLCSFHWIRRTPEIHRHYQDMLRIKSRRWDRLNPDKRAVINKKYNTTHLLQDNAYARRWRRENPDKSRATRRREYIKNRTQRLEHSNTTVRTKREIVIRHYTGNDVRCMCDCACGAKNIMILTVDHINSDGYQKDHTTYASIINRGFPPTYQILCYNCNYGRAKNKGICPML